MKKLWIMALCLILVMSMAACGQKPDATDPMGQDGTPVVDAIPNDGNDTSAEGGAEGDAGDSANSDGNTVNADVFFGDDDAADDSSAATTTTTNAANPADPTASTTTTTKAPTTAKPTTTVAPPVQEEVQNVALPAAGYDMDGKGRIKVQKSEIRKENGKQYAQITFANVSKESGKVWIIPEYSKVQYACYDKNGAEIATGTMPIGALEEGDTIICKVELPAGTVELKLTGHNFEYWTPWA